MFVVFFGFLNDLIFQLFRQLVHCDAGELAVKLYQTVLRVLEINRQFFLFGKLGKGVFFPDLFDACLLYTSRCV